MGKRNSKTDIVWAKDIESVRDLLDYPQEKYDENLMLWGGVSYKGLVPPRRPIFVDELKVKLVDSNFVNVEGRMILWLLS